MVCLISHHLVGNYISLMGNWEMPEGLGFKAKVLWKSVRWFKFEVGHMHIPHGHLVSYLFHVKTGN